MVYLKKYTFNSELIVKHVIFRLNINTKTNKENILIFIEKFQLLFLFYNIWNIEFNLIIYLKLIKYVDNFIISINWVY